jgi:2-polyprenyl-3-methyl-5-hydroxy-6-metoxy-1,4-benzoquinol methylase
MTMVQERNVEQSSQGATLPPTFDEAKMGAFVGKVLGDTSATTTVVLASIGDRLGLFKDLAANGPATSGELAARTATNERYIREWLGAMQSAGYLEYDPASQRFTLPLEHQPILAQESGPVFFGGIHQMVFGMAAPMDKLIAAFKQGGGVPQTAYSDSMWQGMERFTNGWFENMLVQQWLPEMPEVRAKLKHGANLADVGCGRGYGVVKMAQEFPNSRFVGYDQFAPSIAIATDRAQAAAIANRTRFQQLDVAAGLPEQYDIVTTFDVIHDSADPLRLLRAIRQGLKPDGTYICLEVNCSDKLEQNTGPLSALWYGLSTLYCMTTSLADGGAGLGAMGVPESKMRELCAEAGFSSVHRLPLENPFNIVYEIKP